MRIFKNVSFAHRANLICAQKHFLVPTTLYLDRFTSNVNGNASGDLQKFVEKDIRFFSFALAQKCSIAQKCFSVLSPLGNIQITAETPGRKGGLDHTVKKRKR